MLNLKKLRVCFFLLPGAFLLSSTVMSSPIPDIDDAYFSGSNKFENIDARTACKIFNQKVALINAAIKEKYPELVGMDFSNNFCQAIRINDIQSEATFETYIRPYSGLPSNPVIDDYTSSVNTYDLARTVDILILSSANRTNYLMMTNGDINFAKQKLRGIEYNANSIAPYAEFINYYSPQDSFGATGFFHNSEIINLLVDASVYDTANTDEYP